MRDPTPTAGGLLVLALGAMLLAACVGVGWLTVRLIAALVIL